MLYLGLSHELLKEVTCEEVWENDDLEGTGFDLMECAADMGDQSAVIFVAQAYETGRFLGPLKLLFEILVSYSESYVQICFSRLFGLVQV